MPETMTPEGRASGRPQDSFAREVEAALRRAPGTIAGDVVEISRWTPDERVSGLVARADFRGLSVVERFAIVQDALRAEFGERSEDVGLIFVFTPEEFADYDEDRQTN